MTGSSPRDLDESIALFPSDEELRRRISPSMGLARFKATLKSLEHRGFPKIHPIFGGRYWPKVQRWLDKDNEVENHEVDAGAQDGLEDFGAGNASPRTRARPQARSTQPAILDGEKRVPGSQGLSRHLHSVATGR